MSEELTGDAATGLDRRDFIRKGALVGGMVWAAPMISSAPAFAVTITPTPGTTTDPVETAWSFWAAVFTCQKVDCTTCEMFKVKVKYEGGKYVSEGGWEDVDEDSAAPSCEPVGWNDAEGALGSTLGIVVDEAETYWDVFIPDLIPYNGSTCELKDAQTKTGNPPLTGECGEGEEITKDAPGDVTGQWYRYTITWK